MPVLKADLRESVNPVLLVAFTVVLPLVELLGRQTETRHSKGEVPASRPRGARAGAAKFLGIRGQEREGSRVQERNGHAVPWAW